MAGQPLFELGEIDSFVLSGGTDADFDPFNQSFNHVQEQMVDPPPLPTVSPEPNKRRRLSTSSASSDVGKGPASPESAMSEDPTGAGAMGGTLKVTDAIDRIAAEGTVLKFDAQSQIYVVIDGPGFETRFQQLRTVRAKRNDRAQPRPFSKLHVNYILVKGEKWGKTGTAFKAKEAASETHACDRVEASRVLVGLFPSDEKGQLQVTLQHFLNVIGAGDTFRHARNNLSNANQSPAGGVFASDETDEVSEAVHDMWHQGARGDQGYFFARAEGEAPFSNGAIVKLVDGKLRKDNAVCQSNQSVFLVVSDLNVKWKGEPIPTREQEHQGHWTCFLGQIPVTVEGTVECGDYIGPAADGSGRGVVVGVGGESVVGIALASKREAQPGVVKTMCFVGLNAMNEAVGTKVGEILEQAVRTRGMVAELRIDVGRELEAAGRQQRALAARVEQVEHLLFTEDVRSARDQAIEDSGRCPRQEIELKIMGMKAGQEDRKEGLWDYALDYSPSQVMRRWWHVLLCLAVICVLAVAGMSGWMAFGKADRVKVQKEIVVVKGDGPAPTPAEILKCRDIQDEWDCLNNTRDCVWANLGELGSICVAKPVECVRLETKEKCSSEGQSKCGWVDPGMEVSGIGCFEAERADALRCSVVQRTGGGQEECEADSKCEWVRGGATEGGAVMDEELRPLSQPSCRIKAELDTTVICSSISKLRCQEDTRCTWVTEGRDKYCAQITEVCASAHSHEDCSLDHGCMWADLGERGSVCMVVEKCEMATTEQTCLRLETSMRCTWRFDSEGAGLCSSQAPSPFETTSVQPEGTPAPREDNFGFASPDPQTGTPPDSGPTDEQLDQDSSPKDEGREPVGFAAGEPSDEP